MNQLLTPEQEMQQEIMNAKVALADVAEEKSMLKQQIKAQGRSVAAIARALHCQSPDEIQSKITELQENLSLVREALGIESDDKKALLEALEKVKVKK